MLLLSQLQKRIEQLEKENQFQKSHNDPSIIPGEEVHISPRSRLLVEGTEYRAAMEWVLVDCQAGKERWSKWVHASTLMIACPGTELPEELTHALQVARVESSSHRADVSGQLTGLQQEYEAYRKRTKAATTLLQERLAEATQQTTSLKTELDVANSTISEQQKSLETIQQTLADSEMANQQSIEQYEKQLAVAKEESDDLRSQLENQLIAQVESSRIQDELQARMEKSEQERLSLVEDLHVKEAALTQLEKALSLLQNQPISESMSTSGENPSSESTHDIPNLADSDQAMVMRNHNDQQEEDGSHSLSQTNKAIPIQVVSEPPSSLQMPADVLRPIEADHDRLLASRKLNKIQNFNVECGMWNVECGI